MHKKSDQIYCAVHIDIKTDDILSCWVSSSDSNECKTYVDQETDDDDDLELLNVRHRQIPNHEQNQIVLPLRIKTEEDEQETEDGRTQRSLPRYCTEFQFQRSSQTGSSIPSHQ